jgi:hypothetical protein
MPMQRQTQPEWNYSILCELMRVSEKREFFFPLQLGLGQGWNRKKLAPESLRERRVVLLEPGGTQWSEGFSLRILSHI